MATTYPYLDAGDSGGAATKPVTSKLGFNPAYVPAALSIFGGVQGYGAGSGAEGYADDQARLAERNALLARRELAEQVRRQADEDAQLRSAALARAAASGTQVSGSVSDYLGYMEDEQTRQLNWLRSAGASRIRLELDAALRQADATRMRGRTQKYGAIMSAFTGAFAYLDAGGVFTKPTSVTL